jgi:antirestriction protein ArdC
LGHLQAGRRPGLAGSQGRARHDRVFFKKLELRDADKPDEDEDAVRRIPLLRAFTLFNASQIDGIPDFVPPTIEEAPWRAPEAAEIIVANSGAIVRFGGDRAFYSPATDHIHYLNSQFVSSSFH